METMAEDLVRKYFSVLSWKRSVLRTKPQVIALVLTRELKVRVQVEIKSLLWEGGGEEKKIIDKTSQEAS